MDTELKRQHQEHWSTRPHLHKEAGEGTLLPSSHSPTTQPHPRLTREWGAKQKGNPGTWAQNPAPRKPEPCISLSPKQGEPPAFWVAPTPPFPMKQFPHMCAQLLPKSLLPLLED